MTGLPVPGRALAVGAHPDDVELYAGATLATWAAAGCEVSILVCTDGSKGSWDADRNPTDLVATRREEQRAAAERLGATGEVVFLDRVEERLTAAGATVARYAKPTFTKPAPADLRHEIATHCDAVIEALAD